MTENKFVFIAQFIKFTFPIAGGHQLVLDLSEDQWDAVKDMPKTKGLNLKVLIIQE